MIKRYAGNEEEEREPIDPFDSYPGGHAAESVSDHDHGDPINTHNILCENASVIRETRSMAVWRECGVDGGAMLL